MTGSSTDSGSTAANGEASMEHGAKTEVVTADPISSRGEGGGRTDMPVSAVARLLGVATASDLTLLDGKMDLLINKLNLVQSRIEKLITAINGVPSGADLERIDVQIGALRTALKESFASAVGGQVEAKPKPPAAAE